MRRASRRRRSIAETNGGPLTYQAGASWPPDGRQLAFTRTSRQFRLDRGRLSKESLAMSRLLVLLALLFASATPLAHAQQRPLKVLVLHDMEGLAGEDDWREFSFAYPDLYA